MKKIWMAVLLVCLCGCACPPTDPTELQAYQEIDDPLEPMNRSVFAFNSVMDKTIVKPVAKGYRAITTPVIRKGVRNFFNNLNQPIYLANALLQFEGKQSLDITKRFFTNTLFGFFGFADTASEIGIPVVEPDFGQTLYVWGVKDGGPFLMLPVLGPSNIRDGIGRGVDGFADPVDWALPEMWQVYARFGAEGIAARENNIEFLDSLTKTSTDPYATLRTMYRQNRKNKLEKSHPLFWNADEQKKTYEFDFPMDDEDEE